jgi:hypothetical protein
MRLFFMDSQLKLVRLEASFSARCGRVRSRSVRQPCQRTLPPILPTRWLGCKSAGRISKGSYAGWRRRLLVEAINEREKQLRELSDQLQRAGGTNSVDPHLTGYSQFYLGGDGRFSRAHCWPSCPGQTGTAQACFGDLHNAPAGRGW